MDQNIQKALWLGVGVMMFVAIVSTGLYLFNRGQALAEESGQQLDRMSDQLASVQYQKFDNLVVNGSSIVNAIREYKQEGGDFIIEVHTSYPSTIQYVSTGSISSNTLSGVLTAKTDTQLDSDFQSANDSTATAYINPHGEFLTQLVYDSNDVVKGIIAIQQ